MYQQIVDMELQDLENEKLDLQQEIASSYQVLEEMWVYHPANPNFINPIKAYDELKKSVLKLESKINDLELKIQTLKSTN
jgi:predicted  nucleic acid-binding Zn-ribbon protein